MNYDALVDFDAILPLLVNRNMTMSSNNDGLDLFDM